MKLKNWKMNFSLYLQEKVGQNIRDAAAKALPTVVGYAGVIQGARAG